VSSVSVPAFLYQRVIPVLPQGFRTSGQCMLEYLGNVPSSSGAHRPMNGSRAFSSPKNNGIASTFRRFFLAFSCSLSSHSSFFCLSPDLVAMRTCRNISPSQYFDELGLRRTSFACSDKSQRCQPSRSQCLPSVHTVGIQFDYPPLIVCRQSPACCFQAVSSS
jgi:hypothetical protein